MSWIIDGIDELFEEFDGKLRKVELDLKEQFKDGVRAFISAKLGNSGKAKPDKKEEISDPLEGYEIIDE